MKWQADFIDVPSVDMNSLPPMDLPISRHNRQDRRHPTPWISKYKLHRLVNVRQAFRNRIAKRRLAKWYTFNF